MIFYLIVLVKMIIAHLLGDFIFQTDRMCRAKSSNDSSRKYLSLSLHALIQASLTYVLLAQWENWIIPTAIAVSHFLIDWIKSFAKNQGLIAFIVDQSAHFFFIFSIWWIYYFMFNHQVYVESYIFSFRTWIAIMAFITILSPASTLIKYFLQFEKWTPDTEYYKGLPNAGKWIGYLERILILIFIFTNNIVGIGFLLAAKSIFRFGELNKAKDLKITEYVLIGTFTSFTIAIIIAYTALSVIDGVYSKFRF